MDWKEALTLPAFIISLFAFLVSGWTAIQLGRIDFERRRQDLLSRVCSVKVLQEERADAWARLVLRLDKFDPESGNSHLKERWSQLRDRLEATHGALATGLPDRSEFLGSIENMPNGLFQRVKLEAAIGAEDRILSGFRMAGWDAELAADREDVASIEAAFSSLR